MRLELYKQYGLTLDHILDLHGITEKRWREKKSLHSKIKKSKDILTLKSLTDEELSNLIEEIEDFFPNEQL